ncbi:hypothetical protein [Tautonia marina]|uniref:hypothetical protein n=1 Tax=Tautonia marina TaxID=2653855 RepID=UPI001260D3B9|nr:hypothetical protein [Tautonia marina]
MPINVRVAFPGTHTESDRIPGAFHVLLTWIPSRSPPEFVLKSTDRPDDFKGEPDCWPHLGCPGMEGDVDSKNYHTRDAAPCEANTMNPHPGPEYANPPTPDLPTSALTHGLTAQRPLCAEEVERMQVLVASWTSKAMPETPPEEALIASATIEYVRDLRSVDAEESRLKPGAQQTLRDCRDRKQHAVRSRAQELKHDPADVVADRHETAFGIDWMLRHWRHLRARLASGSGWALDHLVICHAPAWPRDLPPARPRQRTGPRLVPHRRRLPKDLPARL